MTHETTRGDEPRYDRSTAFEHNATGDKEYSDRSPTDRLTDELSEAREEAIEISRIRTIQAFGVAERQAIADRRGRFATAFMANGGQTFALEGAGEREWLTAEEPVEVVR